MKYFLFLSVLFISIFLFSCGKEPLHWAKAKVTSIDTVVNERFQYTLPNGNIAKDSVIVVFLNIRYDYSGDMGQYTRKYKHLNSIKVPAINQDVNILELEQDGWHRN